MAKKKPLPEKPLPEDYLLPAHQMIQPLSEADRVLLEEALAHSHKVADLIKRIGQCGVNVDPQKAAHEAYHTGAKLLLDKFFPPIMPDIQE